MPSLRMKSKPNLVKDILSMPELGLATRWDRPRFVDSEPDQIINRDKNVLRSCLDWDPESRSNPKLSKMTCGFCHTLLIQQNTTRHMPISDMSYILFIKDNLSYTYDLHVRYMQCIILTYHIFLKTQIFIPIKIFKHHES